MENEPNIPPTREHEILFTREERGRITALGRVAFSTVRDRDDAMEDLRESFDVLSAAVTSWVDTEPSGWECWEQSSEDLNIGDLACYYQGEDMLKPWGILRLKVDVFASDNVTHYDRHLVDEDKLRDRDENEETEQMKFINYIMNQAPALSELKTSILRAKVCYLARIFGWRVVEQHELDRLADEEAPVSIIDLTTETKGSLCPLCPLTGKRYSATSATIRYQRLHVTISWTWWLAFRLKHVVGVNVHPDIPVHIVPGAYYRSIMIGWLEEPDHSGHERS